MVLLDAHKISQSELADALGVGKSAVSNFWEGDRERLEYYLERIRDNIPLLHGRSFEPVSPYRMDDIPDDLRKITPEQWEAMRKVDIRTVDKSQLVDIRTIKIDEKLPPH